MTIARFSMQPERMPLGVRVFYWKPGQILTMRIFVSARRLITLSLIICICYYLVSFAPVAVGPGDEKRNMYLSASCELRTIEAAPHVKIIP